MKIKEEFGSFDTYIWGFADIETISKDLKKRGFNFVGPTTIYAFMQAVGLVNDHAVDYFRYREVWAVKYL